MKIKFNHICKGLVLSSMIFASTSCADSFLDLSNPSEVGQNTFWKTEGDALMALTACYDALQSKTYTMIILMVVGPDSC